MKLIRDPFFSRLLMALAVYATMVGLWTHGLAQPSAALGDGTGQAHGLPRPPR